MVKLKFKKLHKDAELPSYAKKGDSGMDIRAYISKEIIPREITIYSGQRILIGTGIAPRIPKGYELQVRPRSGLALKQGLTVLNSPGTIDEGYTGEICVIMINHDGLAKTIKHGYRIAQLVLAPVTKAEVEEVKELQKTERGSGGFGSTGI